MFEFLKKTKVIDNSSVKKDDYMISRFNDGGSDGVSYFITNYERLQINNWLKDIGVESISFSDILRMLGFDKDKKLWLERIPSEKDEISFSFRYVDEFYEGDKITIYKNPVNYRGYNRYKIKVFNDNYELIYYLWMVGNNLKLEQNYIKENVNDKIYMRSEYDGIFRIDVKNNLFYDEIILVCRKMNVSEVNNEEELKEYLLNIDGNVSVREIYKKICEISLGNEDKYDRIAFSLVKDNQIVESVEKHDKRYFGGAGPDYRCDVLEDEKKCFFTYDKGRKSNVIFFKKDNYDIKVEISFDFKLDDMMMLREYFMNLEFPVKINEICKDFRDKFLVDLNNIPYFRIETYKDNKYSDNLFIKNGEVHKFEMTIGDKSLMLSEDGMFYYSSSSSCGEVDVDMLFNDDVVTRYEISLDKGIVNENMGNVMYNHINKASDEKVKVKKMIDEFF